MPFMLIQLLNCYHSPSIWHTVYHLFSWLLFQPWILFTCLLQLFFIKCSNNLFIIESADNTGPCTAFFAFLITMTSSDQFRRYSFVPNCKGGLIANFFGKNTQIHLIITRKRPPGAFILIPLLLHLVALWKTIFEFQYSYTVTNFELTIFFIMLNTIVNIHTWLNISRLHF